MKSNIEFEIKYNGKTYTFDYGSEAFIFHTGIYNDIDKKYGFKSLLDYVFLVHSCYLSDSNNTPLGTFADFAAANWKKVRHLGRYRLLEMFYDTEF